MESMKQYEAVGDKLMSEGKWEAAERAISHAMGDCCRIPCDNYNMLPDYKRLLKKHIECLEHMA